MERRYTRRYFTHIIIVERVSHQHSWFYSTIYFRESCHGPWYHWWFLYKRKHCNNTDNGFFSHVKGKVWVERKYFSRFFFFFVVVWFVRIKSLCCFLSFHNFSSFFLLGVGRSMNLKFLFSIKLKRLQTYNHLKLNDVGLGRFVSTWK